MPDHPDAPFFASGEIDFARQELYRDQPMSFSTTRRVEFRDTDAAGIVHFSVFFPMMEVAEHELLRSLDISVLPRAEAGNDPLSWPRVAASCNYLAAARFEDQLRIDVRVAKIGTSSVQYEFRFVRDEQLIAEGKVTSVCCHLQSGGGLKKSPIPDSIRERLAKHQ